MAKKLKHEGQSRFLHNVVEETEAYMGDKDQLPIDGPWHWSLDKLESVGIPKQDSLRMLEEYDELRTARNNSEIVIKNDDGNIVNRTLKRFDGIEHYVALHMTVIYAVKYQLLRQRQVASVTGIDEAFPFFEGAAYLYAKGRIDQVGSIATAGIDILRYKIWMRGENQEAYERRLVRLGIPSEQLASTKKYIDALLGRVDEYKELWDELEELENDG